LKVLKLATNKLCFGHPGDLNFARKLSSVIKKLGKLEHIDLGENSINDDKFMEIYPSLLCLKNLKILNI
jgi:hypothetical protein